MIECENWGSILKDTSYCKKKKIIIYGAGAVGRLVAPYLLKKNGLDHYVVNYVDNDERKHGTFADLNGRKVRIISVEDSLQYNDCLWLITNGNYDAVLSSLEQRDSLKETKYIILPKIQSMLTDSKTDTSIIKISETPLIPKVIHYIWLGGNEIPERLQKCIDSWKKVCPSYEIKQWDESNLDLTSNAYVKQAYEMKKYGFASDLLRMVILYKHGGIYIDTDVELIKPLDDMLYQTGFCGVEKWGYVNSGGSMGCAPGNSVVKQIIDYRKNEQFVISDGNLNMTTCGIFETLPLVKKGFRLDNTLQTIDDMNIYPADFFCPFNYMNKKLTISDNTFCIHHFDNSWK